MSPKLAGRFFTIEPSGKPMREDVYILHAKSLQSCVHLFVTVWTLANQAPLSMGFSRQGYWSGLPCPPPGDLPDPGIEPSSLTSLALAGSLFTSKPPGKPHIVDVLVLYSFLWLNNIPWHGYITFSLSIHKFVKC